MITMAAIASLAFAGYADCNTCGTEPTPVCRAWTIELNLQTLGAKKTTCKTSGANLCDTTGAQSSNIFYLDDQTRKLKGLIWVCEYQCSDTPQFNCVIWDSTYKCSIISYDPEAVQQVSASDLYVYGKKGNRVVGTFELAGKDSSGEDALAVVASGIKGYLARPIDGTDCFIKSLSGTVAGKIKYIKPYSLQSTSNLCCGYETTTEEFVAKLFPFCSVCAATSWCEADDAPDMVPCVGTWKMKYNGKIAFGTKSVAELVPSYAQQ